MQSHCLNKGASRHGAALGPTTGKTSDANNANNANNARNAQAAGRRFRASAMLIQPEPMKIKSTPRKMPSV